MSKFENYYDYVAEEADNIVEDNQGELKKDCVQHPYDLHEYFDQIVHDHVDSDFVYTDLYDFAHIIEQSFNLETDSGLWAEREPIEAIETQAFFTYRNDLMGEVVERSHSVLEAYADELGAVVDRKQGEVADKREDIDQAHADNEMDEVSKEAALDKLYYELEILEGAVEELKENRENVLKSINM